MKPYLIRRAACVPAFSGEWNLAPWDAAERLTVNHYHPYGSDHRPAVEAKVLYDDTHLYVYFRVRDRYVRAVHTTHQDRVCKDSCVEFFFQPRPDSGYFNIEANCGGTFLMFYITDCRRIPGGFEKYEKVDLAWMEKIRCWHSLPQRVDTEITEPVEWGLEYAVPLALMEAYCGPLGPLAGQTWRGNFYKCADDSSHPHWGAWSPVGTAPKPNFHEPRYFGPVQFAP